MTSQTLSVIEDLSIKLQELRPENQQLLLGCAEFLLERQTQSMQSSTAHEAESSPTPQRILGLHQGMGWTSDDFNPPLPDGFWTEEA
ncbi:MAG: DUF2281 domain-containing protein [Roseofilum sp. SBFL]|uniref:DUF2281 domain-containing protein n=1 Tax=unclassified Roseofilum TaxID=2620099 RepID=UPI001B270CAC|nr:MULTISPECIES: DUF2281 domain-containing protein [unclassified Roseofilum]MBP0014812.1 DUF2281 domain-containing protein [Roseofilum sp. SID3]MBP0023704.1 DUF2281 domain-containing protein [Roseofilum sp. SID2]MBP0037528.1 DUF2281 domain-containing protein [Roseofilum sp. SID1]MBP0042742.1 DUF2281 domain-containing protein [Roseofilum sp. SBFL]